MFVCVCVRLIYIMPDTDHHFARCITALFENLYLLQTFTQRTIDNTTIRRVFIEFKLGENFVFKETRKTPLHTAPLIILNLATFVFF